MANALEKLPIKIEKDGEFFYLRIKPRATGKKWCIRYIGKEAPNYHDKRFEVKVRGYTYKTLYQFWGNDLDCLVEKALKTLCATKKLS